MHVRTAKMFPCLPKLLLLPHWICLCPQLGNNFCTQHKGKAEALPGTLTRHWESGIDEGYKFGIVSAMPLFGIYKGEI